MQISYLINSHRKLVFHSGENFKACWDEQAGSNHCWGFVHTPGIADLRMIQLLCRGPSPYLHTNHKTGEQETCWPFREAPDTPCWPSSNYTHLNSISSSSARRWHMPWLRGKCSYPSFSQQQEGAPAPASTGLPSLKVPGSKHKWIQESSSFLGKSYAKIGQELEESMF